MRPEEYYRFEDDKKAITFLRHDAPAPWINYLSNGNMHAYVSQAGGAFLWWQSPRIFRLTRYRMYNLPTDTPGFYIYIRDEKGNYWNPTFLPSETALDEWHSQHQPGITHFYAKKDGLEAKLSLFIAPDYDTLLWDVELTNTNGEKKKYDVFAYVEYSMHEWLREVQYEYYNRLQLRVYYEKDLDALLYLYHADNPARKDLTPLVYFGSQKKIDSWCGDREQFTGFYRSERNPIMVEKGECNNDWLQGGEGCGALHSKVELGANEKWSNAYFIGCAPNALMEYKNAVKEAGEHIAAFRKEGTVAAQREKLDAWWSNHLNKYQADVPDEDIKRQVNVWSPVQSVHTGRYSRSLSQAASGDRGFGYRDTASDMLAIAYRDIPWAKEIFRFLLESQFADGRALHQMWPIEKKVALSTRQRIDDQLWLPFVAKAIISETGDLSLLEDVVSYYTEGDLPESEGTVWEHMMRAVEWTETQLGAHGLPLILKGDWNDIVHKFADEGKGESVFFAMQYITGMRMLVEMGTPAGKEKDVQRLKELIAKMEKTLQEHAWDGEWFRRAYDDNGNPVGSKDAAWGRIWLTPQAWSVISGVGTREQQIQALDSLKKHNDTKVGIQLLTPSFDTFPKVNNPFSGYCEGSGENGAIFCQSNPWVIAAEAKLGRAENAWKYYRQLVPHLTIQEVGLERYRAEPYAFVSNILGPDNKNFGYGNVNQVTGTAAWMDLAVTQYLLGVQPEIGGLVVDPCIPKDWNGFTVKRVFRGCDLDITVDNSAGVEKGVKSVTVDGANVSLSNGTPLIPAEILSGKKQAKVVVTMG